MCMVFPIALMLDLAKSLPVVVVLDNPPSYSCAFRACLCLLLLYKSWFRIHLHKFLSTCPNLPNDSSQLCTHLWGKNARCIDGSLLALFLALHGNA